MRWAKSEYILKGVFLGLLAVRLPAEGPRLGGHRAGGRLARRRVPGRPRPGRRAAAPRHQGTGPQPGRVPAVPASGKPVPHLLRDHPRAGRGGDRLPVPPEGGRTARPILPPEANILGYCVLGGAMFGYGLGELRQIEHPLYRLGITAILCAAVGVVLYYWLEDLNLLGNDAEQQALGRPPVARHPVLLLARVLRHGRGVRGRDRGPVRAPSGSACT